MVVSGVGSGVSHDEKVLAMKKTSAAPFRHSLISPKCAGITTSDALKSMRTNSYPINSDIRIGEGTSHCTDVQVDQVSARFIPHIRGVQLGRPTSKITPLSGS